MQIRNKLTLQFTAIVAIIMITFSVSIFYIAEHFRNKNFNKRLKEKAITTTNLLIEVEEINEDLLKSLRRNYLATLPGEFVRVYNIRNKNIYRDDTVSLKLNEEQLEKIRNKGELNFQFEKRQLVGVFYKDKYVITSSAIDLDGKRQMSDLKYILIIGNIICLVIIMISGKFFSIQSLKPIAKINKEAENINENNLGLRLDEGQRKDEISQLAITFNKLFDRLQDAFERQKRFVSNASHELRTPLTSITGEIEVILLKERSKEEYIEVMLSVLEEAKTLTKLSNGLLQLAQTGDSKGITIEKINLYILIEKIKEEAGRRFPGRKLEIVYHEKIEIADYEINGNEELLKIAIINIIENAFKFSLNKPVISKVELINQNIIFKIIDSGIGIIMEDLTQIIQPFYRSENATNIPGHGIGLSLSEKIIKLHEGSMEISSQIHKGTTITIVLPILKSDLN
jgi:signal transduction histidine kinase